MTKDEVMIIILVAFMAAMGGGLFGITLEESKWKQRIRDGKGPEIIKVIQMEDEARAARQKLEND